MDQPDTLSLIRSRTSELVSRRLRSSSAVVARMRTCIEEANRLGHPHRAIYEAMKAGGLLTNWNGYEKALARARKAERAASAKAAAASGVQAVSPPEFSASPMAPEGTSATQALDALLRAKHVASRDYARVARDHYRKVRP